LNFQTITSFHHARFTPIQCLSGLLAEQFNKISSSRKDAMKKNNEQRAKRKAMSDEE
jgi:hypothetical protein